MARQLARWLRRLAAASAAALLGAVAATPPAQAQTEAAPASLAWIEGNWHVGYVDQAMGPVVGVARVRPRSAVYSDGSSEEYLVEIDLVHPKTGATYRLAAYDVKLQDGRLEFDLEGKSPPSGMIAVGEPVPSPVDGATPLAIPVGATVTTSAGGDQVAAEAVADEIPPRLERLHLQFEIPAEGPIENIAATWSYKVYDAGDMRFSRAGDYDETSSKVSGGEVWTRPTPVIRLVTTLGQPDPGRLKRALGGAEDPLHEMAAAVRRDFPPDGLGRVWLAIGGFDLPVQPRRRVDFSISDTKVTYTGAFRRNPKHPDALDVEVVLHEGLENAPKPLVLNGVPGSWLPDLPGNEPFIRHVRRTSESEFEAIDTAYVGEALYVEAVYPEPPFADLQRFETHGADGQATGYTVERVEDRGSGGALYRSPPLLLLETFATPPTEEELRKVADSERTPAPRPAVTVAARAGTRLESAAVDAVGPMPDKTVAYVTVADVPPSPWEAALERARECRAKGAAREVTHYIASEAASGGTLKNTIAITEEDHAAAILAREELVRSLDGYAARLNSASPVDHSAAPEAVTQQEALWTEAQNAEAEAMIQAIWQARWSASESEKWEADALYLQTVTGPDGSEDRWNLLPVLLSEASFKERFGGDRAAFLAYARRAIAEAKGKMAGRASDSLRQVRAIDDCNVVELLQAAGVGTERLLAGLLPDLVRPARPDEPGFPRVVPDRVARAAVAHIGTLAEAIAAQTAYNKLDTDAVVAAVTAPFVGLKVGLALRGAMQGAGALAKSGAVVDGSQVATAVITAADIYGAYAVGRDMSGWDTASRDADFSLGLVGIAGTERWHKSQDQARDELFSALLQGGLTVGLVGVDAVASGGKIDLPKLPKGVVDKVRSAAMKLGVGKLAKSDRDLFDQVAAATQAKAAADGASSLTPEEASVLAMAGAAQAGRPTGPVGRVTRPSVEDLPPPAAAAEAPRPAEVPEAAPTAAESPTLPEPGATSTTPQHGFTAALDSSEPPAAPRPGEITTAPRPEAGPATPKPSDNPTATPGDTTATSQPEASPTTPRPDDTTATLQPEASPATPRPGDTTLSPRPEASPTTPRPGDTTATLPPGTIPETPRPAEIPPTPRPAEIPDTPGPGEIPATPPPGTIPITPRPAEIPPTPRPEPIPDTPGPGEIPATPQPGTIPVTPKPAEIPPTPRPEAIPDTPQPGAIPPTPRPSEIPDTPRPGTVPPTNKPADLAVSQPGELTASPKPGDVSSESFPASKTPPTVHDSDLFGADSPGSSTADVVGVDAPSGTYASDIRLSSSDPAAAPPNPFAPPSPRPRVLNESPWARNSDGSFRLGDEAVVPADALRNPIDGPPDVDNAFVLGKDGRPVLGKNGKPIEWRPKSGKGLYADVRDLVRKGGGEDPGAVVKTLGEREAWIRTGNPIDPATGACNPSPCWVRELTQTPEEAAQMYDEILEGAAHLEDANVTQLGLLYADPGPPPVLVQRTLGKNMPKTFDENGKLVEEVVEEQFADDMAVWAKGKDGKWGWKLEAEQADAMAELMAKLSRSDLYWMDPNLRNVFFQHVRRADGTTFWRAGISDTDFIASFSKQLRPNKARLMLNDIKRRPKEYNIHSGRPGFGSAEEAALTMLEQKGYITWDAAKQCFADGVLRLSTVEARFPSFRRCPGRSSALSPGLNEPLEERNLGRHAARRIRREEALTRRFAA